MWCVHTMPEQHKETPATSLNQQFSYGTLSAIILLHSDIVNGHQLLCNAHNVLEQHRGTAALQEFVYVI